MKLRNKKGDIGVRPLFVIVAVIIGLLLLLLVFALKGKIENLGDIVLRLLG